MNVPSVILLSYLAATSIYIPVHAKNKTVDVCLSAIQIQKPGEIVKLEKLTLDGQAVYEFEVKDSNGFSWDLACNSIGTIIRSSQLTGPGADAFLKATKISEREAAAIALAAYPGKLAEVIYKIRASGRSSYEFNIVDDQLVETKVGVDAANGKIIEVFNEEWEVSADSSGEQ